MKRLAAQLLNRATKILPVCPGSTPSLRCRLLVLTNSLLLITLFLIGLVVIKFVYDNEQRTWQGRQGEAARYASENVACFLERTQHGLFLISLLGHNELVDGESEVMADLLEESPALLELILLDTKGKVLAGSYRDAPLLANLFTIPQSRWFLESQAGQRYLGNVQISADSEPYLIIALPARDRGVVAARLRLNLLWQVVSSLHFGETGQTYVINQDGSVIAHTDPAVAVANVTLRDRPELEALLGSPDRGWTGSYTNFKGIKVLGVTQAIPGTSWKIVTELPYGEAFATSRTAVLLFGGGIIEVGVLVLLVMRRILQQSILDPVDRLRVGTERIGAGDLSYRLDTYRQDELGQVAIAFNQMADRLYKQRGLLEARNTQLEQLYQTSLSLTSNLDLKHVLDAILQSTFKLISGLEDVHLFLYQADRIEFVTSLWADGRKDYLIAEPRPGGLTYTVAQQGEIMVVPDIQRDRLYPNPPPEWRGALVGVPLKIGMHAVGVMNVAYTEPHHFQEEELRVLRLLGDQAAIALENARLYEQAQHELAERKRAEEALRTLNYELERRVAARTIELTELNQNLLDEIGARKLAEEQVMASLREKEVLLKEIHHRVKNNMQVISSLLNLQSGNLTEPGALEIFKDSQNRVRSMALIHEKLYRSENLAQIDFGDYIQDLTSYLFRSQNGPERGITLKAQADVIFLDIDAAVPCGLIINELVSNSLKHAFPNGQTGEIVVDMRNSIDQQMTLVVRDNGVGLPPELDFRETESLGLQLVNTLVDQLDGSIELDSSRGSEFKLIFPPSCHPTSLENDQA